MVFHAGTRRDGDAVRDRRRPGARRGRDGVDDRPTPGRGRTRRVRSSPGPGFKYRHDIAALAAEIPRPAAGAVTMIPRYSLEPMASLFADDARYGRWLEVEILAVEAWAELGVIPTPTRPRSASGPGSTSPRSRSGSDHRARRRRVRRRRAGASGVPRGNVGPLRAHVERRRRHRAVDGAGRGDRPPPRRRGRRSRRRSSSAAREFADTPMVGRTHGIHAEPTTFGAKLALWALQVRPRPRAPRERARTQSRSASSRARSGRTRTSIRRSRPTCAHGSAWRPCPRRR